MTFDSSLSLDIGDDTNIILSLRVQTTHNSEKEKWLFGEVVDHVEIYGSRSAEGLSTFYVVLVFFLLRFQYHAIMLYIYIYIYASISNTAHEARTMACLSSVNKM